MNKENLYKMIDHIIDEDTFGIEFNIAFYTNNKENFDSLIKTPIKIDGNILYGKLQYRDAYVYIIYNKLIKNDELCINEGAKLELNPNDIKFYEYNFYMEEIDHKKQNDDSIKPNLPNIYDTRRFK